MIVQQSINLLFFHLVYKKSRNSCVFQTSIKRLIKKNLVLTH